VRSPRVQSSRALMAHQPLLERGASFARPCAHAVVSPPSEPLRWGRAEDATRHHLLHEGACCGVRLVGAVSGTLDKCGCRRERAVAVGPAATWHSCQPRAVFAESLGRLSPEPGSCAPALELSCDLSGPAPWRLRRRRSSTARAGRPRPRTGLRLVPRKADYRMADVREQNSAWVRRRERHMRCRIEVLPPTPGNHT